MREQDMEKRLTAFDRAAAEALGLAPAEVHLGVELGVAPDALLAGRGGKWAERSRQISERQRRSAEALKEARAGNRAIRLSDRGEDGGREDMRLSALRLTGIDILEVEARAEAAAAARRATRAERRRGRGWDGGKAGQALGAGDQKQGG